MKRWFPMLSHGDNEGFFLTYTNPSSLSLLTPAKSKPNRTLGVSVCVCACSNNLIHWVLAPARHISPTLSRLAASPPFISVNALITGRLRRIEPLCARNLPTQRRDGRVEFKRAAPFFHLLQRGWWRGRKRRRVSGERAVMVEAVRTPQLTGKFGSLCCFFKG